MTHDASLHERSDAILILGIHIGTLLQQKFHHVQMTSARGGNEGSQLVPIPNIHIHLLLLEQLLHQLFISVGRSTDQTRTRRAHGLNIGSRSELQLQRSVRVLCRIAWSQLGLLRPLGTNDTLLHSRAGFSEDISRFGISVDVPCLGTAVRAFGKLDIHLIEIIFFVGINLIAILFGDAGSVGIDIGFFLGPFVYLIGAGGADDEEEGVDGTSTKFLAGEAEGVGGVLEEEGGWTLGFGDSAGVG
mmetsp:Transcript_27752/g.50068  ORF Transcript_27752/g.50068 Transcript_27752/m.50068 type:complete len:245 (-) Transcript_27752:219-953(-)